MFRSPFYLAALAAFLGMAFGPARVRQLSRPHCLFRVELQIHSDFGHNLLYGICRGRRSRLRRYFYIYTKRR